MILPIKGGRITAPFSEPRPLGEGPKTHIHGALDVSGGNGIVLAPASGYAQGWVIFRGAPGQGWPEKEKPEILRLSWKNYWQDIYGGIIILHDTQGRLHILCHFWPNSLISTTGEPFYFLDYVESAGGGRWPNHLFMTVKEKVTEGQPLERMGSAGFSTGPHVHWEIHHQGDRLDSYSARINPETLL